MHKFIVFIFIFCLLSLSQSVAVSVNIPCEKLEITQEFYTTVFEGAPLYGEPGQPLLPVYSCDVLLPPDVDLNSVHFSISGLVEETLEGTYTVQPALPPFTCEGAQWPEKAKIVNGKDVSVYSANRLFPQAYIRNVKVGKLRCFTIAKVSLDLVRYNPVTGSLKRMTGGTLTAAWSRNPEYRLHRNNKLNVPASTIKKVKNLVVNYNEFAEAYERDYNFTTNTKYVIMTTAAIQNSSTKLNSFVESRRERGFNVEVVLESTVGSPPNKFSPDDMRTWLQQNYQSQAIEYVLIIGCPHMSSGDVPMKKILDLKGDSLGTDFYFGELTGDINDTNDYHSEIDVGRIPVYYNKIDQVDVILQRTLDYENEQNRAWRHNALLIADPLDDTTTGSFLFESIRSDIYDSIGWSNYRIYNENYGNPDAYPTSYAEVGSAWNANAFGIIQYFCHGSGLTARNIMNGSIIARLTTDYNPIVIQGTCKNGLPTEPRNLAYTLLNRCALSVITGTWLISYSKYQTTFARTPSIQGFNYELARALAKDSLSSAKALNYAKSTVRLYTNYWTNFIALNVYGVPDVGIFPNNTITPAVFDGTQKHKKSFEMKYFQNRISFQVPQTNNGLQHVSINLYNLQGKCIATLLDENRETQQAHSISIDNSFAGGSKPAPGLYLCTLHAGEHNKTLHVIIK